MTIQDISRRNAETVEQVIKTMNIKLGEQQERIDGLHATISMLNTRLDAMELIFRLNKIKEMGTKATI